MFSGKGGRQMTEQRKSLIKLIAAVVIILLLRRCCFSGLSAMTRENKNQRHPPNRSRE